MQSRVQFLGDIIGFTCTVTLEDGKVFTLWVEDDLLVLRADHLPLELTYRVSESAARTLRNSLTETEHIAQDNPLMAKPVIYLYPEERTEVTVRLDLRGELAVTIPQATDGSWTVTAEPDGSLTDGEGTVYPYLFWDGYSERSAWRFDSGFVVEGADVERFFREVMPGLGLSAVEYEEFIDYWAPILRENPYTLITFYFEEIDEVASLHVTPQPDTVWRVHMIYYPLESPVDIPEQQLPEPPRREGFTVIEWGGTLAEEAILPEQ